MFGKYAFERYLFHKCFLSSTRHFRISGALIHVLLQPKFQSLACILQLHVYLAMLTLATWKMGIISYLGKDKTLHSQSVLHFL